MPTSCLLATSHQTKLNIEIPVQLRRIPGQTNVVYSCSMMQAMWNYMATNVFIIDISYHATGSKTRFSKASSQYQCYLTPQTTSNISRYWRGVAAALLKYGTLETNRILFTLSPSWTSTIFSPVAGLTAGKTFPLTEFTNSLLMKICQQHARAS